MEEPNTLFLVMYITTAILIYTGILVASYIKARNVLKRQIDYMISLHNIIEEIKETIISKEENIIMKKELTLSEVVSSKPTEEDYQEVLGILKEMANTVFNEYKFLIVKSDKATEPHFLQMVSSATEHPDLHKKVFEKSIKSNLDYEELTLRFAEEVKAGNVIDLGDDVTVIIYDGKPGGIATGVSKFVSGLEDAQIQFNITFVRNLDYEEWHDEAFKEG